MDMRAMQCSLAAAVVDDVKLRCCDVEVGAADLPRTLADILRECERVIPDDATAAETRPSCELMTPLLLLRERAYPAPCL